ncbi:7TM receptor with intracellular metal dependent phosphohydrolase [Richelia sinica FACHB-800]|uniref:7TM receptor with intracellular metal dependent phosphohydrolase n=1 Tax=Richelia sinica FACHB-800 TaxID=1357546 RepID=A0A975T670_9NOST|nr:HD family phosphohydrolase [Richelia sinica]MBD2666326.1 HD family phosphohydrolase [Richelia sinica FACHB-800]QXE22971.1 7TM receptor with intracellular metal dependent phosphohydrolase [Richelia sinica FACHB-800]
MNTKEFWQSLSQRLREWQQQHQLLSPKTTWLDLVITQMGQQGNPKLHQKILKDLLLYLSPGSKQGGQQKRRKSAQLTTSPGRMETVMLSFVHKKRSSVLLVISIISLTGVVGKDLYRQPKLKVGIPANQTFIAPSTDEVEDKEKTEMNRKAAKIQALPILMIDQEINQKINQNLQQIITTGKELRNVAGAFPFFDISFLSIASQRYLRSCSESEWQQLQLILQNRDQKRFQANPVLKPHGSVVSLPILEPENLPQSEIKQIDNVELNRAFKELETYLATNANKNLSSIIYPINQARKKYNAAKNKLAAQENIYNETVLLELSDDDWSTTQAAIHQSVEKILTQGIAVGLPDELLSEAVKLQIQGTVPNEAESLASKILLSVLEANLKPDADKTKQQAQQAADNVTPVMVKVKQGEVIVKKGEIITEWKLEVLKHYHLVGIRVNWLQLTVLTGVVTAAVGIFVWVEKLSKSQLRQRDRLLILLLTLSTPGVLALGLPYTTWSGMGLLLGSFYGSTLGVTVVGLLSFILPIGLDASKIGLVAGLVGGVFSSVVAPKLRSREELALLGIVIAVIQGSIYLIFKIFTGAVFGSSWYFVLQETGLFAVSGLAWSVVALGISPYLEKIFDLITPIRLAELANPNRPLLQRLATETPGTFQHTLLVATLAEAAAKELGCNVELVRAGTLYHDIGKMHDPQGFIENQMAGPNKHETEIKDPWQSAAIIKKHVTEGLVMAKKHSLPTAIQAFIPEHQGTMTIAYFYHQAQQIAKEQPNIEVNEADFRYDGPIPQSRETGIVMLADSSEAALRSLKDGTPEQAINMLNNILRARWQDGQLAESGLKREEMTQIAQIFVEVWQQFHHKRIAYPKQRIK